MRYPLILLLLIACKFLIGQDATKIELLTEIDSEFIQKNGDDYCHLAKQYNEYSKEKKDSSLYFSNTAYLLSEKCNVTDIKADLVYQFAKNIYENGEFEKAVPYCDKSIKYYTFLMDTLSIAKGYNLKGCILMSQSSFQKSLSAFNKAANYYHEINNIKGLGAIELNIGIIYSKLNRIPEAKEKHHHAMKLFYEINDSVCALECVNNLGVFFRDEKNYDSAYYYMYKNLNSQIKNGTDTKVGFALYNIASTHFETDQIDSAKIYLDSSILIKTRINSYTLGLDYCLYGKIHVKNSDYDKAILAFEKSKSLYTESDNSKQKYTTIVELANAYFETRNFKKSAINYNRYFSIQDSLKKWNNFPKIQNEISHYEIAKDSIQRDKIILQKQLQDVTFRNTQLSNHSVKNQLYFISTILAIIVFMGTMWIISFKKRLAQEKVHQNVLARQNQELKLTLISKEEKETLLKEIHHRVKNNLQIISSLIRLQSGYMDESNFKERLSEVENRIASMALVHEKLYQSNDFSKLEVRSYIRDLCMNILESYDIQKKVRFQFEIEAKEFNIDTLIPLGLILTEIISNALKHAFKKQESGLIAVKLKDLNNHNLQLLIRDNGLGSNATIEELKEKSLGMDLIFSLTEQLDGTLEVDSSNGFSYNFTFPKRD